MDVQSKTPSRSTRGRKKKTALPEAYTVQCSKCLKWRNIESYEEYEVLRSRVLEEPYMCENKRKPCGENTDLKYNDLGETWVVEKPSVPKSPTGFKRILIPRKDNTRVDVYYMTPCNKRLRSFNEAAAFIKANQAYKDVPLKDFDFRIPKVINDSVKQFKKNDSVKPSKKDDNTESSEDDDIIRAYLKSL